MSPTLGPPDQEMMRQRAEPPPHDWNEHLSLAVLSGTCYVAGKGTGPLGKCPCSQHPCLTSHAPIAGLSSSTGQPGPSACHLSLPDVTWGHNTASCLLVPSPFWPDTGRWAHQAPSQKSAPGVSSKTAQEPELLRSFVLQSILSQ